MFICTLLGLALGTIAVEVASAQTPDHVVRTFKRVGADSLVVHVFRPME